MATTVEQSGLWVDKFRFDDAERTYQELRFKAFGSQHGHFVSSAFVAAGKHHCPVQTRESGGSMVEVKVKSKSDFLHCPLFVRDSDVLVGILSDSMCHYDRHVLNQVEALWVTAHLQAQPISLVQPLTSVTKPSISLSKVVSPVKEIAPQPSKGRKRSKRSHKNKEVKDNGTSTPNDIFGKIAKAREDIKSVLNKGSSEGYADLVSRVSSVEKECTGLKSMVCELSAIVKNLSLAVQSTQGGAPATTAVKDDAGDDDDIDFFDSDEEDEGAKKLKEARLAAYAAKKTKKPAVIAKSSIVLDVKPWEDTTDMKLMEQEVRKIEHDGLLWGAAKLVPVGYGIKKLQISCVVEDDKVSVDWLQEQIEVIEELVQSVDIAAFNKI